MSSIWHEQRVGYTAWLQSWNVLVYLYFIWSSFLILHTLQEDICASSCVQGTQWLLQNFGTIQVKRLPTVLRITRISWYPKWRTRSKFQVMIYSGYGQGHFGICKVVSIQVAQDPEICNPFYKHCRMDALCHCQAARFIGWRAPGPAQLTHHGSIGRTFVCQNKIVNQ